MKITFDIKMCLSKFSIELTTFQIDDKYLITNNIRDRSVQIFEIDDSSVSHQPNYTSFFCMTHRCIILSAKY